MNKIKYAMLHMLMPVFVLGVLVFACAVFGGEMNALIAAFVSLLCCCGSSLCWQEIRRMDLAEARRIRRAARRAERRSAVRSLYLAPTYAVKRERRGGTGRAA